MNISAATDANTHFADNLARFADAVAIWLPNGNGISYQQLDNLVNDYSATLVNIVPKHSLLALRFGSTLSAVVAYLAALRNQQPLLLVAPDLTDAQLSNLINRLQIAAVIQASGEIQLTGLTHLVRPDCALLLSTSGSSGSPKSVMLSLKNLDANARAICQYLPIIATDIAITALPLHYSYGLSILNSHLHKGAAILLTDAPIMSKEFWQQMRNFNVSSLSGVPFSYQLYRQLRIERMACTAVRYFTQAGGKLNSGLRDYVQTLAKTLAKPVYLMYGQTEATARIAYLPPELINDYSDCIGLAIPEGELLLRHPSSKQLITEPLTEGELCYRGPNVMLGYASCAADLTSNGYVSELSTGDLAERLPNGLYRIVGRLSRFIKLQGKRLQLDNLEQQLATYADIAIDTIVCAGQDELLVVAFSKHASDKTEQIAAYLRDQLLLHPAYFKILRYDTLPYLSNGKLHYLALLQQAVENSDVS